LEQLQPGWKVKKGQQIGAIGAPPENGNWPSHLHFQIILDLLDCRGDFPGVAFPDKSATWLSISPDPGKLFPKLLSLPKVQMDSAAIIEARKRKLGRSLSIAYRQPLQIVRGYLQYLYDDTGRRYLDTVNNVPHVGHQHPRVIRAGQQQMAVLNTNTRYLDKNIIQYAEALLRTFPAELSVIHFVNSGSEANELALRMVEAYTGSKNMIAVEVGYHGNTS
jgi:murein DD-endopeptidase MepM/ murein hydrolase activator NlpD